MSVIFGFGSVPSGGGGGSFSAGVSTLGNTSGNTGTVSQQLILAGGNNVTLSQSTDANGATVTISAASAAAGSFSAGVSTLGNTAGNTGTVSNEIVFAGGNNITLSQSTAAGGATITISGPNTAAQTNQTLGLYGVGNTTGQSSSTTLDARTISFDGAGIISVGYSAASIVISATTPAQTNQTEGLYAVGNTTGQSSSTTVDARTISFDGAGIVSVGYSGGSVIISATDAAQTNQTLGLYAEVNTTLTSSTTVDARSLSIAGEGIASVGMSNGSLIISVPSGGGGGATFSAGVSTGGNTSGNTGTVSNQLVLAGGNNITLSESTAAGGATVTISAFNQSNQSLGIYATGNTTGNSSSETYDARSLTIEGDGGISVGWSTNNSHLIISGPQTVVQTNQTLGIYASGNTTGNSSSETYDARSLTIDFDGIISGGWSTNNSHLLISAVQSNQTEGLYAVGNTTGQSSSTTVDARTLSVDGAGIVSVGYSGGSLVISATDAAQTNQTIGLYAVGNTTQNSSTTLDARTVSLDGLGIITVGYSNGSVQISASQSVQTLGLYAVGNTTGQSSSTTLDARSHSFEGAGNVSVGYSNGSEIISGPPILSAYEPYGALSIFTIAPVAFGQNTVAIHPFVLPAPLTATRLNMVWNFTNSTGATASGAVSMTARVGIYSRETANTAVISQIFSTSITGWMSASSNASFSVNFNGLATSSAGSGLATQNNGAKIIAIPFATSLPPAEYWVGYNVSTASVGTSNIMSFGVAVLQSGIAGGAAYPGDSVASRTYLDGFLGRGAYTATSGALPTTVNLTQLNAPNFNFPPYMNMMLANTY